MTRYLVPFAAVGLLVPIGAYLLSVVVPLFPLTLLGIVTLLCPSYAWFGVTAACNPFDACSLQTLAWVTGANLLLYLALAFMFWYTRARWKILRIAVSGIVVVASAWWANLWVGWV